MVGVVGVFFVGADVVLFVFFYNNNAIVVVVMDNNRVYNHNDNDNDHSLLARKLFSKGTGF